jgi:hypothetical protein
MRRFSSENGEAAGVMAPQTFEDFHDGRLPGAVRTDEGENFTDPYLEADIVHRLYGSVRFAQIVDLHKNIILCCLGKISRFWTAHRDGLNSTLVAGSKTREVGS